MSSHLVSQGRMDESRDKNPECPTWQVRHRGTLTPEYHMSSIKMHGASFPNLLLKSNKLHIPEAALSHLENIFPGVLGGGFLKSKFGLSPPTTMHWPNAAVTLRGYWANVSKVSRPEAVKSGPHIWSIPTSTIRSKAPYFLLQPLHLLSLLLPLQ